jgi:DNA polymerase III gamma/tau subunit
MSIITKYRPKSFDQVLGQKATTLSIKKALKAGLSRAFLFIGPSGVGKTTLARLIAAHVGCSSDNILEVDAATYTGIDAMRELMARLQYKTIDDSPRCVIVDEAHALSKSAFQSLLKIVEEPPSGVYWCLCTSEGDRIPKQIKTRCSVYNLRPVLDDAILGLLQRVRELEGMTLPDTGLDAIVEASEGSPRQALVYLGACGDFKRLSSIKEVLTQTESESAEAIELCRLLLKGNVNWKSISAVLRGLTIPAESVRIIVLRYMAAVSMGGGEKTMTALEVMSNFQTPFLDREGMAPLVLACGSIVFGEDE